jgi:hypothetical protein
VRLLKSDSRRAKRSATGNAISDNQTALHFDQISGDLSGGLFNRAPNCPRTLDGLEPVVLVAKQMIITRLPGNFFRNGQLNVPPSHVFPPSEADPSVPFNPMHITASPGWIESVAVSILFAKVEKVEWVQSKRPKELKKW